MIYPNSPLKYVKFIFPVGRSPFFLVTSKKLKVVINVSKSAALYAQWYRRLILQSFFEELKE